MKFVMQMAVVSMIGRKIGSSYRGIGGAAEFENKSKLSFCISLSLHYLCPQ